MDGSVTENAASEVPPRLGALGKVGAYLRLIWRNYRRVMDGSVTENAAFEVSPRLGALGRADAYLRLVWRNYRRRRLFAGFRDFRLIGKSWSRIGSLSTDDRKRLRRRFLAGQRTLLRTNWWFVDILWVLLIILLITAVLAFVYIPHNLVLLNVPLHDFNAPQSLSETILGTLFAVFLISSVILLLTGLLALALCFATAGVLVFVYIVIDFVQGVVGCFVHMNFASCHQMVFPLVMLPVFIYFMLLLSLAGFVKTILDGRCPQEIISDNLFHIITLREREPSSMESISLRRTLVGHIERIALIVRSRLFLQMPAKEPMFIARRKQQSNLISHIIMERAAWLLTPGSSTREDILAYFVKMMIALLDGTWDDFFDKPIEPTEEMMVAESGDKTSTDSSVRRGVLTSFLLRGGAVIRGIIVAGIPIIVFYLIQTYKIGSKPGTPLFTIAEPTHTYITAGLVVWSIIVIVSTIDPLFEKRVSALKEIAGALRGGDSPGKK